MTNLDKVAFLFPGQGAQYVGMGKSFFDTHPIAKQTLEEAEDILHTRLSTIILEGPLELLTTTKNSQTAIYVVSMAILRVIQSLFPHRLPYACSGLSLGEYSALCASGKISFAEGLKLVRHRGEFMNDACEQTHGSMAVVLGLEGDVVEKMVAEAAMPQDLWAANFNCPGQVVISGTLKGIAAGIAAAKAKGAKRVLPLTVHGAFHSGLMNEAKEKLTNYILEAPLQESPIQLVMNVTGAVVKTVPEIRQRLIEQVTHPVRWEEGIRSMVKEGVNLFVEIGCGKTLAGFNKRIVESIETISVEEIGDLERLFKELR